MGAPAVCLGLDGMAAVPAQQNLVILDSSSSGADEVDNETSCGSLEFHSTAIQRRLAIKGRRALQLEDLPVQRLDDDAVQSDVAV